jgi:large subunit ribosomal protein L17
MAYAKLGKTTSHRRAMFRNMVTSLFKSERIQTTEPKAKEVNRIAEKLITLAKRGDLHARRQVLAFVNDEKVVGKLFDTIAPKYEGRPGGYTRIIKVGARRGDAAEMVILELV